MKRDPRRDDSGSVLLESAFAIAGLVMMTVAIIELGVLLIVVGATGAAAQAAADAVPGSADPAAAALSAAQAIVPDWLGDELGVGIACFADLALTAPVGCAAPTARWVAIDLQIISPLAGISVLDKSWLPSASTWVVAPR